MKVFRLLKILVYSLISGALETLNWTHKKLGVQCIPDSKPELERPLVMFVPKAALKVKLG